jgi:hypothetical protein
MAFSIPNVKSGDVIASALINQIIQALQNLDSRVSALEAPSATTVGAPKIQAYSPTSNLHIGDSLTVTGQNLWAGGLNSVYIVLGGAITRVTQFTTQNDTQLVFNIPAVSVQPGGSLVSLQVVSPTQGSDSVSFTLLPAAVTFPTGEVRIQLAAPSNTTFNAGASYKLSYTINSTTTLGDTYDLNPTVDATGWSVTMLDNSGNPISNATVYIAAAPSLTQPTIVSGSLQITIPAGVTGSANLQLNIVSHLNPTGNGLTISNPKAQIPVGGKALLSSGIGINPSPSPGNLDASGNLLVPTTGLTLTFDVTISTSGNYTLQVTFDNDAADWSGTVPSPINFPTGTTPIQVQITPKSGAQPSNIYLTIAEVANSSVSTQVFYPVVVKT